MSTRTSFPKLDEPCKKIFTSIIFANKKFRFNELLRFMNKDMGYQISNVTLAKHLKHLVKNELLLREENDIQNISYRFNVEGWEELNSYLQKSKEIQEMLDTSRENFNNFSVESQIAHIHMILIMKNLELLKNSVMMIKDPQNKFKYNLMNLSLEFLWKGSASLLLSKCAEGPVEYIDEVLEDIEKWKQAYIDSFIK